MKKIVAIMLVLVALSTSVFAGDSYLSLEFDFAFQTVDVNGFEYEKDSSNGYLGIGAEWTNYFGDSSIAGLLLGFVYNGPIYSKAGDVTAPITTLDYELIPRVGLALKFDFTDSFSLESGLSLALAIGKADRTTTEYFNDGWIESNTYTNTFTLDVYGRLGIIWKFSGSWAGSSAVAGHFVQEWISPTCSSTAHIWEEVTRNTSMMVVYTQDLLQNTAFLRFSQISASILILESHSATEPFRGQSESAEKPRALFISTHDSSMIR